MACACSLASLALMVWSLVGQVLGTLSFVTFLAVVVADMRTKHVELAPRDSEDPPAP